MKGRYVMRILKPILFITLTILLISSTAYAKPKFFKDHTVRLGLSFYTVHWCGKTRSDGTSYNNHNNIIELSIDNWFVSTFSNSEYDRSYAFGYVFRTPKWHPFDNKFYGRLNADVGMVYGYRDLGLTHDRWTPGILPTMEIGWGRFAIDTIVIPFGSGVTSCLFKYTF
jgi:hypothetical protein